MLGAIMYFCIWFPLQIIRLLWWNWTIEGLDNLPPRGKGMVLAINHLHWLDILIIGASLPLSHRPSWIAKVEIFINRAIAWWFREMMVIPIKRGQRDLSALSAAEEALKRGEVLIIFPEGHRSAQAGLLEGRGGAIRLAVRTNTPIVPIAIWGTEVGLKGAARRKSLHFRIGKPYSIAIKGDKIPFDRMNELTEEMMLRIAELMPPQYWGFYRERMRTLTHVPLEDAGALPRPSDSPATHG
ncbi:MAG TPA: lysophospholipid acyltransferase family protein [Roseiflexaceae bacterium]|nr:lysophospholipid acyltransferase family protein [Roseiflexaceae bacterium]